MRSGGGGPVHARETTESHSDERCGAAGEGEKTNAFREMDARIACGDEVNDGKKRNDETAAPIRKGKVCDGLDKFSSIFIRCGGAGAADR